MILMQFRFCDPINLISLGSNSKEQGVQVEGIKRQLESYTDLNKQDVYFQVDVN